MSDPTEPPDWVKAEQGKAKSAFNEPARTPQVEKEPEKPRAPLPRTSYEMPGPDGKAVRRQVQESANVERSSALDRANRLEADRKAAGLEHEAKLKRAGQEEQTRKSNAPERAGDTRRASENAKHLERGANDRSSQAAEQRETSKAAERAERLKLAQEFNNKAQYREKEGGR